MLPDRKLIRRSWLSAVVPLVFPVVVCGTPTVEILELPAFGSSGDLHGEVTGVDPAGHRVATYIYVDGAGWWTKPMEADPAVAIGPDGRFSADVTTGGLDPVASIFCAAVIPATEDPPLALGQGRVPAELDAIAVASTCQQRLGRTIEFAGYQWAVKEASLPIGPGGNRFASDNGSVWVDDSGLHLTIRQHDSQWWSTEVVLPQHLGYGTYVVQTVSRLDMLDSNATFGAFTWDPYGDADGGSPNREVDFEDSRWGDPSDPTSAQFVVQPWDAPGNLYRHTLPNLAADARLTRFFTWTPEGIHFVALQGHYPPDAYPSGAIIAEWQYPHAPDTGHFVPTSGRAQFHFNLWLYGPEPREGEPIEVVVSDFWFERGVSVWHNIDEALDVNDDGFVSPIDALQVINDLNRDGPRELRSAPHDAGLPPPYRDTNNDYHISPIDALLVINELNRRSATVFSSPTAVAQVPEPHGIGDVFSGIGLLLCMFRTHCRAAAVRFRNARHTVRSAGVLPVP